MKVLKKIKKCKFEGYQRGKLASTDNAGQNIRPRAKKRKLKETKPEKN